jgi:hypothetical protein
VSVSLVIWKWDFRISPDMAPSHLSHVVFEYVLLVGAWNIIGLILAKLRLLGMSCIKYWEL